jgi:CheY-like chemotaxis protein
MINAEHAMPNGGVIHVHAVNCHLDDARPARLQALSPGPYVNITVRDGGTGIEASHLQHIFDPYFTTKPEGNGLGLTTASAIMKKHQGTIYAESEVGAGTTFHLYLPASPSQRVPTSPNAERPMVVGGGRILVMEDDATLHDVVGNLLDSFGYQVVFAKDGHETLLTYQQAREAGVPFDAVVLDLTIPGGMGGRQTLSKLLAIDPQVKAIVASGYATDPVLVNFEHYGFCGGIAKPYRAQQLYEVLQQLIEAPAAASTISRSANL